MDMNVARLAQSNQVLFAMVRLGLIAVVYLQSLCGMTCNAGVSIARANLLSEIVSPAGTIMHQGATVAPVSIVWAGGHLGVSSTPLLCVWTVKPSVHKTLSFAFTGASLGGLHPHEFFSAPLTGHLAAHRVARSEHGVVCAGFRNTCTRAESLEIGSREGYPASWAYFFNRDRISVPMIRVSSSFQGSCVARLTTELGRLPIRPLELNAAHGACSSGRPASPTCGVMSDRIDSLPFTLARQRAEGFFVIFQFFGLSQHVTSALSTGAILKSSLPTRILFSSQGSSVDPVTFSRAKVSFSDEAWGLYDLIPAREAGRYNARGILSVSHSIYLKSSRSGLPGVTSAVAARSHSTSEAA